MERILGIGWDLDGVLIESELYHADVDIAALAPYGINLTRQVWSENMGMRMEDFFLFLARKYGVDLPQEKVIAEHNIILSDYFKKVFPAVEHAQTVLSELSSGYTQGLNTSRNKTLAEIALQRHGLLLFLTERVYGDDVKVGKPDPSSYLLLAQRMNLRPSQIAAVEDTEKGFRSARAAGMFVIGRRAIHNAGQDFSMTDRVVEDLREIPRILAKII